MERAGKIMMWIGVSAALIAVVLGGNPPVSFAQELVVADFNSGDKPNNIGGDFGSWDKDPEDDTQWCRISFDPDDATLPRGQGFSLRLTYDVDSPNDAYNGFWMKLEGYDFSQYNTLCFYVKGDPALGFTDRIKIELKTFEKTSSYLVGGVTARWKQVCIPLKRFRKIKNFSSMSEFVIVFDETNSVPKTGAILIDNISFVKK